MEVCQMEQPLSLRWMTEMSEAVLSYRSSLQLFLRRKKHCCTKVLSDSRLIDNVSDHNKKINNTESAYIFRQPTIPTATGTVVFSSATLHASMVTIMAVMSCFVKKERKLLYLLIRKLTSLSHRDGRKISWVKLSLDFVAIIIRFEKA